MAPDVAQRFQSLVREGLVHIIAGSIANVNARDEGIRLYVRTCGDDRLIELRTDWVMNCTGPAASNSVESNPAIGSLLVHGHIRADRLGLGLETTSEGNAVDAQGSAANDLFVVGTLRKPTHWESTAVPELRVQAAAVAKLVLNRVLEVGARFHRPEQISNRSPHRMPQGSEL
jgi:uncharacterized NAD(P)/FAD-binding protein YdhS